MDNGKDEEEGMGEGVLMPMVTVNCRVKKHLNQEIAVIADRLGMTHRAVLEMIIEDVLNRLKQEEPIQHETPEFMYIRSKMAKQKD